MRTPRKLLASCAAAVALLVTGLAPVAGAGENGQLEGRVNIEFPSFDRVGSAGCKASKSGSVYKLKKGNRVLVYRGVIDDPDTQSLEISDKPIGKGKVAKGTYNDITGNCDMSFSIKQAPVLPADEFYVVEVKGMSTTQTVSAETVIDGNLGDIPAEV